MISAKQIRAARNLVGMTQQQLAADAGVAVATLMNIETGRTRPGSADAMAIKQVFERLGVELLPGDRVRLRPAHIGSF